MKNRYLIIPSLTLALSFGLGACNNSERAEEVEEVEAVEIGTADTDNATLSITQAILARDSLSTFLNLLEQARMAVTLDEVGNAEVGGFTVFAPTNAAFDKLPAGTLEELRALGEAELRNVLSHHIISRRLTQDEVINGAMIDMLDGRQIPIKSVDGVVMVGDARVVTPAIEAANGVIHTIDQVLLPTP